MKYNSLYSSYSLLEIHVELTEVNFCIFLILGFIFISYFNISEIGICAIHIGVVVWLILRIGKVGLHPW